MEQEERKDPELVKVIDEALSSSKTSIEALNRVQKWMKETRGGEVLHLSVDPIIGRDKEPSVDMAESVAQETLMILREGAMGQWVPVDLNERPM